MRRVGLPNRLCPAPDAIATRRIPSQLVNQAFEARGLRPEPGLTLYSLRHTFEDRLTTIQAPEKVVAMLMGYKWHWPRYGLGPSLGQKREWLNRIAF
jgi:integrase